MKEQRQFKREDEEQRTKSKDRIKREGAGVEGAAWHVKQPLGEPERLNFKFQY